MSQAFDHLLHAVSGEVAHFDREAARHRDHYRRGQTVLISVSAAASIVSGLGLLMGKDQGPMLQFVVLCLTTSTAGLGAWLEMRRSRELWQHERALHHGLQDLEREMHYGAAKGEPDEEQLDEWFQRLQQLLGAGSARWAQIVERPQTKGA